VRNTLPHTNSKHFRLYEKIFKMILDKNIRLISCKLMLKNKGLIKNFLFYKLNKNCLKNIDNL
jgi:hypothetical protein